MLLSREALNSHGHRGPPGGVPELCPLVGITKQTGGRSPLSAPVATSPS